MKKFSNITRLIRIAYRVVKVDPVLCLGVHKLAVNEKLGGGDSGGSAGALQANFSQISKSAQNETITRKDASEL